MLGAAVELPNVIGTVSFSSMSRSTLSCWYMVVDWNPAFTPGPRMMTGIWPPPLVLSVSKDSSQVMMRMPSFWKSGELSSGPMLFCSHWSPRELLSSLVHVGPPGGGQSCMLLIWLGTMQEKDGR